LCSFVSRISFISNLLSPLQIIVKILSQFIVVRIFLQLFTIFSILFLFLALSNTVSEKLLSCHIKPVLALLFSLLAFRNFILKLKPFTFSLILQGFLFFRFQV